MPPEICINMHKIMCTQIIYVHFIHIYVDLPPEIIFMFMRVYVHIKLHKPKIRNAQHF